MKASEQIAAKLPPEKKHKAPRRKPGLLHGPRAVEVEDVTIRMKRPCAMCAKTPSVRRLLVTSGGGRYAKVETYCITCGLAFLQKSQTEYRRAWAFLQRGIVPEALRTHPMDVSEGIRL